MFVTVLNTSLKLDTRQQTNSYFKALLECCKQKDILVRWLRQIQMQPLGLELFCKKSVLKRFTKFTKKHLYRSLFSIKLQASGLKETPAQKFSCRFFQIFKDHVSLQNNFGRLLLQTQYTLFYKNNFIKDMSLIFNKKLRTS